MGGVAARADSAPVIYLAVAVFAVVDARGCSSEGDAGVSLRGSCRCGRPA